MSENEDVFTQDKSTGRVHIRIRRNGVLFDNPKCNLDDAGDYVILDAFGAEPLDLCRNCFPEDDGSTHSEEA